MRRGLLCAMAIAACSKGDAKKAQPVTHEEAEIVAKQFQASGVPCDVGKLAALIDGGAFISRFEERAREYAGGDVPTYPRGLLGADAVATKLCAWLSHVQDYQYLHLRMVDGQLHAILRRSTGPGVTYHELAFVRSDDDRVRVADVYSFYKGGWISDEFAQLLAGASGDLAVGLQIQSITRIEESQPSEALKELDDLPEHVRKIRSIQVWRVKLAQNISMDAYRRALEQLLEQFPNDPSVALLGVDGAYFRGDFSMALHYVDIVDSAVGPDPYLEGTRASLLAARAQPGDLAAARAKAETAALALPKLAVGPEARLAVALASGDWSTAIAQMDDLSTRFGLHFDDDAIRDAPMFARFLKTPEYAAWRARR